MNAKRRLSARARSYRTESSRAERVPRDVPPSPRGGGVDRGHGWSVWTRFTASPQFSWVTLGMSFGRHGDYPGMPITDAVCRPYQRQIARALFPKQNRRAVPPLDIDRNRRSPSARFTSIEAARLAKQQPRSRRLQICIFARSERSLSRARLARCTRYCVIELAIIRVSSLAR